MVINQRELPMNLSQLAKASKLDIAIAEARGQVKVTRLAPAKPKRSQLVYTGGVVRAGQGSGRSQKLG